jgi:hypothetical protein
MNSRSQLSFHADEVRLDIDLGDTLLAKFPVIDTDDDSAEDLAPYSLEGLISWPGVVLPVTVSMQLTKAANVISFALSQTDIESMQIVSIAWNYKVWIVRAGERRRVVQGVLVIHE